jgi:hypothetical protein
MQHDNKKQSSALFLSLHNPKGWMVGNSFPEKRTGRIPRHPDREGVWVL